MIKSSDVLEVREWFQIDPESALSLHKVPPHFKKWIPVMHWISPVEEMESKFMIGELDLYVVQAIEVDDVTYVTFYMKSHMIICKVIVIGQKL